MLDPCPVCYIVADLDSPAPMCVGRLIDVHYKEQLLCIEDRLNVYLTNLCERPELLLLSIVYRKNPL